jgi:hypothetical protein
MQVYVPNQQTELLVPLRGTGWKEGMVVSGPTYPDPTTDPFMETSLAVRHLSLSESTSGPRRLVLNFPAPLHPGETATTSIFFANIKSTLLGGAPGEVVIDEVPQSSRDAGWTLESCKVVLVPGDRKSVGLRYTAPEKPSGAGALFQAEHITLELNVQLKWGLPAPPVPDEGRRAVLVLRAHLLPGTRPDGTLQPESVSAAGKPPPPFVTVGKGAK